MFRTCLVISWAVVATLTTSGVVVADDAAQPALESAELGSTKNVHSFGPNLLCGQPTAEEFAEAKKRGIKTVITLREEAEVDWDEAATVRDLGLNFHQFPIRSPDSLTDSLFEQSLNVLADADQSPVMLHCGSANRVGAIWLAHRVLNDGIELEAAREEAKTVGLRVPELEERAINYIRRREAGQPASVKPGINDRFLDPTLEVSEWIGRFEIESREVFSAREKVLDVLDIQPGFTVADIGAGTGFYSRLFASAVGDDGWVYAVDIAPKFLQHINRQSQDDGITNLTSVLGTDRSVRLPPNSVDVVFICDTYHHFEYPSLTLASIHRALRPGGTLVVIDFERIPGKSREFIIGHVRAGKDVFRSEIENAGFLSTEEVDIPMFQENYMLRFVKD